MQLNVNGKDVEVPDRPGQMLLYAIRGDLGLTGTKFGCGGGFCGACTVHVDGEATRSCITPLTDVEGKSIRTLEGLASIDVEGNLQLHPVQEAFINYQVPQCAWCMSGQMMTATAFLEKNSNPSDEEIVEAMGENYCRCGCYVRIKSAVAAAAQNMGAAKKVEDVA